MKQLFIVAFLSASTVTTLTALAGQDSLQLYQKQHSVEAKYAASQQQAKLEACAREHGALMERGPKTFSNSKSEEGDIPSKKQESNN